MAHHNSHVGIPNTLLESYSTGNCLYATDLIRNIVYPTKPENAGVQKDYYDDETEELLSKEIETSLGVFLKELNRKMSMCEKANFINSNHNILEKFLKFQLQRSKVSLNSFNENSMSSKILGNLTHSDYLKIVSQVENINILSWIEGHLFARVCVATEDGFFVTNSLGFYLIPDIEKQTIKGVVIPYTPKEAIYICAFDNGSYSHYKAPDKYLNALNRYCYIFEKSFGNGLIFSLDADCAKRYLK